MRIYLFLASLWLTPLHAYQETEVFQVSKAGGDRDKLMQIFNRIQVKEAGKGAELAAYHVVKRLSPTRFIVHPMKDAEDPASPTAKPDFSETYLLETTQEKGVADKGRLIVMKPELTGNETTYEDQYGACA